MAPTRPPAPAKKLRRDRAPSGAGPPPPGQLPPSWGSPRSNSTKPERRSQSARAAAVAQTVGDPSPSAISGRVRTQSPSAGPSQRSGGDPRVVAGVAGYGATAV